MQDVDDNMVDLVIEDERWIDAGLETLANRAANAVAEWMNIPDLQVVVLGCDDERIAALNAEFRGREVPTNVLSWPAFELSRVPGEVPEKPPMPELGDVAISFDTCQREAVEHNKQFDDHVTHLLVHGVLHLAGYDHIDDSDADRMENTERAILASLGIPDPYLEYER